MENFITVIGAGAWGTAIAQLLARNGSWVCLYTHEADVAATINQTHENKTYLSGVSLEPTVWATTSADQAAQGDVIFIAYPVPHLRTALAPFRSLVTVEHLLVSLCKGIEVETGKLPFEVIGETVGICHMGVVGGPNFAAELAMGVLGGAVVASRSKKHAQRISDLLGNELMKITLSDDPVGVQLCGALKNIIALQNGIITGQGAAENTKAYLMTQALHEIGVLISAYNGRRSTAYSLAGIGDIVLSAMSGNGRNYQLGKMLGQGVPYKDALARFESDPEGVHTAHALRTVIERHALELPILSGTCEVVVDAAGNSE